MFSGLALLAAWLFAVSGGAVTQAHEADGHPARIQQGSCDNLGGVAFQLTGVGAALTPDGTPVATPETVGSADAHPVQMSETTLETSLSQLTKDPYAIVVYESDEAMDQIIACGNVGGVLTAQMQGMVMPGDVLTIWLPEAGDSGYVGVALLEAKGKQATLRLVLAEGLTDGGSRDEGQADDATPHAE